MPLPTVSPEAIAVVCEQIRHDRAYLGRAFDRMVANNPCLAAGLDNFAAAMLNDYGDEAASLAVKTLMIQYICLENQFDAEQLEREIG